MSARRARYLARRQELLELEAQMQRAALAAAFARFERRRLTAWAAEGARLVLGALSRPAVRSLALAAAARAIRRRPKARGAS